jgi:hypothetical protein
MRGRIKPPLGARVNPWHPLARQLEVALLFNETGGTTVYDARTGRSAGTINADVTRESGSPAGDVSSYKFNNAGSSTVGIALSPSVVWDLNEPGSIEARVLYPGGGDAFQTVCTDGSARGFYIRSNGQWQIYPHSPSSATLAADTWYTLCATRGATTTPTVTYYVDGVFTNTLTGASGTGTAHAFNAVLNNTASEAFVGRIAFIRIWRGRELSAPEVRNLYLRPYEMYWPSRRAAFLESAAGGALPWLYRTHTHTLGAGFGRAM